MNRNLRILAAAALVLTLGTSLAWGESWPVFRGNERRTGLASAPSTAPSAVKGELVWRLQTGGAVSSSPALWGNTLFVGSNDGSLYALDAESGRVRWTFPTENWVASSPCVSGGLVIFGSAAKRVKQYLAFFWGVL